MTCPSLFLRSSVGAKNHSCLVYLFLLFSSCLRTRLHHATKVSAICHHCTSLELDLEFKCWQIRAAQTRLYSESEGETVKHGWALPVPVSDFYNLIYSLTGPPPFFSFSLSLRFFFSYSPHRSTTLCTRTSSVVVGFFGPVFSTFSQENVVQGCLPQY